jgi:hypothetical protein
VVEEGEEQAHVDMELSNLSLIDIEQKAKADYLEGASRAEIMRNYHLKPHKVDALIRGNEKKGIIGWDREKRDIERRAAVAIYNKEKGRISRIMSSVLEALDVSTERTVKAILADENATFSVMDLRSLAGVAKTLQELREGVSEGISVNERDDSNQGKLSLAAVIQKLMDADPLIQAPLLELVKSEDGSHSYQEEPEEEEDEDETF